MREIIQKIAGEHSKKSATASKKNNREISYLKNLSGLYEDFEEEKIYIKDSSDVEKFYTALIEAFEYDTEALNIVKDIFNKVIY